MSEIKETKGKILLDTEENNPILDFNQYVEAIYNIIQNSDPNFSIGIYGEWGTGKTTLMSAIKKKIENSETNSDSTKIVPVWFNAWRYEREENQATIPLMKTIAYTLEGYSVFKPTSDKIKKAVWAGAKEFGTKLIAKHLADIDFNKIREEYDDQIDKFPDIEKDTIFYDGLEQIKQEILKIREDPDYRIVVFIDDLDRCSPKKTLEVFESIKAFLDISGLIFVIGLSFKAISDLITKQYEGSGIKGEDYIKKIIQVPIFVQEWNASDTLKLIQNISEKLVEPYKKIIGDDNNAKLLSISLEKNPREIKRFINTFIISNEIYSKSIQETTELLLVRALKWRWPEAYNRFNYEEEFRNEIKKSQNTGKDRKKIFTKYEDKTKNDHRRNDYIYADTIEELIHDNNFWEFMNQADILFEITDWEKYRRATAVTDEKTQGLIGFDRESLVELLKKGKINDFNNLRSQTNYTPIRFENIDLRGLDLVNVNLGGVDLTHSNLANVSLRNTYLIGTNLKQSVLTNADLSGALIRGSDLSDADLSGANLQGADLRSSTLKNSDLFGADLTNVALSETNLSGVKNLPISEEEAKRRGAKFS